MSKVIEKLVQLAVGISSLLYFFGPERVQCACSRVVVRTVRCPDIGAAHPAAATLCKLMGPTRTLIMCGDASGRRSESTS